MLTRTRKSLIIYYDRSVIDKLPSWGKVAKAHCNRFSEWIKCQVDKEIWRYGDTSPTDKLKSWVDLEEDIQTRLKGEKKKICGGGSRYYIRESSDVCRLLCLNAEVDWKKKSTRWYLLLLYPISRSAKVTSLLLLADADRQTSETTGLWRG